MNLRQFTQDVLPSLFHGAWVKAARILGKHPKSFSKAQGWPHLQSKAEELEKVLDAWGYELVIKKKEDE